MSKYWDLQWSEAFLGMASKRQSMKNIINNLLQENWKQSVYFSKFKQSLNAIITGPNNSTLYHTVKEYENMSNKISKTSGKKNMITTYKMQNIYKLYMN